MVPTIINVSLTASSMPLISFSPAECCYFVEVAPNQPAGPSENVTVVSNGNPGASQEVSFSANTGGNCRLTVSPLSGMTPLQLTVTANPAGLSLPSGGYSGQITLQGPANTVTVTVGLNVLAPPPSGPPGATLRINGPPLTFTLPAGAPSPMGAQSLISFQEFDVALTSVQTNVGWLTASIISPGTAPPTALLGVAVLCSRKRRRTIARCVLRHRHDQFFGNYPALLVPRDAHGDRSSNRADQSHSHAREPVLHGAVRGYESAAEFGHRFQHRSGSVHFPGRCAVAAGAVRTKLDDRAASLFVLRFRQRPASWHLLWRPGD